MSDKLQALREEKRKFKEFKSRLIMLVNDSLFDFEDELLKEIKKEEELIEKELEDQYKLEEDKLTKKKEINK